ncbi:MAG: ElyC/SanA/YdcF family protein [Verrucomicrobiales bacterium]|jgi:SanA protein|nr:ElyC/SanA/YdcF family protein [Verrucomicrobiales bacterium]
MARKRRHSILFWLIQLPLLGGIAVVLFCNFWIVFSTSSRVYDSVAEIEARPVGLVLGTTANVAPDTPNRHFENRIAAAADLLSEGKVSRLLVSGYRDSKYYDETEDMRDGLLALGVAQDQIIADNKGARTLDSVARAESVFGFDRFVIISDDFHVARAVFIADRLGLDAIALRSQSVDYESSRKVRIREYFARVKAVLDLFFWDSKPEEVVVES